MNIDILIQAHKQRIQNNPFTLSGNLYPLVDNGYGEMIEDRQATPEKKDYTNPVRISTRKKLMLEKEIQQTPVNTQLFDWFMVSDNETIVDVRLEFTYQDIDFRVTNRRELNKHNGLFGYEYELKDLTEGNSYA